jgi:hypothetical protein
METRKFKKALERVTDLQKVSKYYLLERAALLNIMNETDKEYEEQLTNLAIDIFFLMVSTSEFILIAEEMEEYEACSVVINESRKIFTQTSKMFDNNVSDEFVEESFNKFISDLKNI